MFARFALTTSLLQFANSIGVVSHFASKQKHSILTFAILAMEMTADVPPRLPSFKVIDKCVIRCDPAEINKKISYKAPKCACKPDSDVAEDRRACAFDTCINRAMKYECPEKCSFGAECQNRRFQKVRSRIFVLAPQTAAFQAEYPPLELFFTGLKGWGVRTRVPIARGTFIIEYVGEIVDRAKCHKRGRRYARDREHKHHYLMGLDNDLFIDATKKGNIARFINHSCEPNAMTEKVGFVRVCSERSLDCRLASVGR